ncbi:MAG: PDDEXK nuclease domain-containing protein [Chloroflexota bacterium]
MDDKLSLQESADYKAWIMQIKTRIRAVQLKAAVAVNSALIEFYWELGADIVEKQKNSQWGSGFLKQLSQDLMTEFPDMKGFSHRNLKYIRQWYRFYNETHPIGQQPVAQLDESILSLITQIPWGHNLVIISKCKSTDEALYYVNYTLTYGWSRSVLTHHIESRLWEREGKALSNFSESLPLPQSDLAQQTLKDPYVFDFLTLAKEHSERDLEQGLIEHITQFLLELGAGFAYVGRQVPLQVGDSEFFLDLLFYHTHLHCYVVIELKTDKFKPEYAGKLNFYLKATDELIKREGDQPTIGLLLCQNHDRVVAEWALSDINKPIGISEYQLTQMLPDEIQSTLPSIEQIEAELSQELGLTDESTK